MDELGRTVLDLVQRFSKPEEFLERIENLDLTEKDKPDFLFQVGIRLHDFAYFNLALRTWNKALEYYGREGDRGGEAKCYNSLGAAYHSLSDYSKATEYCEKALRIFRGKGDKRGECDCHNNLGACHHSMSDYRKAINHYTQSLDMAKEIGLRASESHCYLNLAVSYQALGDYRKAIEYYQKSLEIALDIGDRTHECKCYNHLGTAHHNLGDYGKALEYSEKSLHISKQTGDKRTESDCYTNLGAAYHNLGDYGKAIEYYEKSLAMTIDIGNRAGESACYGNLGIAYYDYGNYRKAIRYHEKSLEIAKDIGDREGESKGYNCLGASYHRLGDHRKARACFEKSSEIAKEIGDKAGELASYANLGIIYKSLRDYTKALNHYEKSLEIAKQIGDKEGESACYSNLGVVHSMVQDYRKAIEYFEKSLVIAKQTGDKTRESGNYANLSKTYDSLGDHEKAVEYGKMALELFDKIGDLYGQKLCLENMGRTYFNKNDFEAANGYYKRAVDILENMRDQRIPEEYKRDFWKDNIHLFDNLVVTEVNSGRKEEALEYSERGKGRTISDFMLSKSVKEVGFKVSPLTFKEMEELCKRIQRNLVLLRVTTKGTYAFILVPEDGFELIEIPDFDIKRLEELVVKIEGGKAVDGWFYRYFNYRSSQQTETKKFLRMDWFKSMDYTLDILYDELIGKIFSRFKKQKKVVIIPNRSLNILPLHACFYKENGSRHYLLEDYEITYAPNCTLLDLCYKREEENRRRDNLFAIANPYPEGHPDQLIFSALEVREIEGLFKEKEVYIGQEVADRFLEGSKAAGVIHLSTHGSYDLSSSFNSRLSLGKNMYLTLEEIFEKVRLDQSWLVCLSACETGLTDFRDIADEYIGLQTGFLCAGAPTVIASLWTVSDLTTALIMIKTYENIFKGGLSKAKALREAQLWCKNLTAAEE